MEYGNYKLVEVLEIRSSDKALKTKIVINDLNNFNLITIFVFIYRINLYKFNCLYLLL